MQSRFSDKEKSSIVSQYWGGTTVSALCAQYHVPRSTLYSWLKRYKLLEVSTRTARTDITQKEYADLKRHADKLERILEVIRVSGCAPTSPLEERLAVFTSLQGKYSNRVLCEALHISKGTFHNRIVMGYQPTVYERRHEEISKQVRAVFEESEQRYGADKILAVLTNRGVRTSKKYVLRIMREMGLQSIGAHSKKNYVAFPKKQNIIQRQFQVNAPNAVWVSDVTCFPVKNMYLYICVIIDLFSRKVIAYRISHRNSTQLITATFKQAFQERGNPPELTFHSDQGSQYTANAFRRLLIDSHVTQSFSHPGSPTDNAVAESFFALMKREELYRRIYHSEKEFRESVDSYIGFYNSERPHRANGYRPPVQAEATYCD